MPVTSMKVFTFQLCSTVCCQCFLDIHSIQQFYWQLLLVSHSKTALEIWNIRPCAFALLNIWGRIHKAALYEMLLQNSIISEVSFKTENVIHKASWPLHAPQGENLSGGGRRTFKSLTRTKRREKYSQNTDSAVSWWNASVQSSRDNFRGQSHKKCTHIADTTQVTL